MKPKLPNVTLVCVDTTDKAHLAQRAIEKSLEQCDFGAVKFLTNDSKQPHAAIIPKLSGLEGYSRFCIRELHKHVETSHALLVQYDGYVLNGEGWTDDFLKYDYIGAPWLPSKIVGNGGFSLRSKKLLQACASMPTTDNEHPEDNWIAGRHRQSLEHAGVKFAPYKVAERFAFEGRSWNNGIEWAGIPTHWQNQFGFHSWLTPFPENIERPKIFHHSGDMGDVIYALPSIRALGGGVLFLSPDNKFPFPFPTRWSKAGGPPEWADSLRSLCNVQPYIWNTIYTHALPYSVDVDFNSFRKCYRSPNPEYFTSLFRLHQKPCGVNLPDETTWLTVPDPIIIPGRPIVVNRTSRFQERLFAWCNIVRKYGDKMVFVGTEEEAETFKGHAPEIQIPYRKTKDLLELARVIAGAKVFMGNQSAPMAIAMGLGKNIIQEVWPGNPNCRLRRHNVIYPKTGNIVIPEKWLA